MSTDINDADMGSYVYCKSHVGPHATGWCTVDADNKISLAAATHAEAFAEVKAMGLPIYGYCRGCYRHIINELGPGARYCKDCEES